MIAAGAVRDSGLSPLTRGNPALGRKLHARAGPIPAHAGQPRPAGSSAGHPWAYPRSRGATAPGFRSMSLPTGLSPLTRGNHRIALPRARRLGPIPAHAGQPRSRSRALAESWAYPRSRGATISEDRLTLTVTGLSPLTRGNPLAPHVHQQHRGPIPAHAGQPRHPGLAAVIRGAYPRSRGATNDQIASSANLQGLSPLTRGNPAGSVLLAVGRGPIPAHAGQPPARRCRRSCRRAYPRSRGATVSRSPKLVCQRGLSPLTRGNPGGGLAMNR